MKKATKGTILKQRIKEMGFTQERFSQETGVPYSTLKKYLADKTPYDVDLLQLFAEKLECSYDYLMGYSVSPDRDLQSVKDRTRLSDGAIGKLEEQARGYDINTYDRYNIDTISKIIESEELVDYIGQYLKPTEEVKEFYSQMINTYAEHNIEMNVSMESAIVMNILNQINLMKYKG